MQISIPDEKVQEILTELRRVPENMGAQYITTLIEQQLLEGQLVDEALGRGDLVELHRLSHQITAGHNRFRVLNFIMKKETGEIE